MNLIVLFCFIIFSSLASANEKSLALTADNLTLLALKNSPENIVDDYTFSLLKSNHTKKYFQLQNNKEQLNELLKTVKSELVLKLADVPNKSEFSFSKKIKFTLNKNSPPSINIENLFPNVIHAVLRSFKINKGLPDYFDLLISNLNILNTIAIEETQLNKLHQSKKKELFVEATLVISNYQNQQDFQVVIKELHLYLTKNKKTLLASIKEDRSYEAIVENWLISGGLSTKLIGIHAFSLFGHRVQDTIRKTNILNNSCKKTNNINNHIVLTCKIPYTENSLIISVYVGGILAQLDLIVNNDISEKESRQITRSLTIGLKKPYQFFTGVDKKWDKFFVDFSFFPLALDVQNSPDEYPYNLLFSMTSQNINKIFQEAQ
jgi:hypothetical protein